MRYESDKGREEVSKCYRNGSYRKSSWREKEEK